MQRLVSDIGGTNARFALVGDDGLPTDERTLKTKDFPGVVEAARTYLGSKRSEPFERIQSMVLVVAGPVEQEPITLTNCPWSFSLADIKGALGVERLIAINDFVAQALAIPRLRVDEVEQLGGGAAIEGRPIVVIGPGTGLGVAGLLKVDGLYRPIATEGGHVAFAPKDAVEDAVLALLRGRFGHVSNERLLSGPGLVNFANALAELDGAGLGLAAPAEVVARAEGEGCPFCIDALARFSTLLGAAAGDLALAYGAHGGVYLAGGMIGHLGRWFDAERVLRAFVDKGRFEEYVGAMPLMRVLRTDTGLIGAAAASVQMV
ncbi:MAG: glucokinase [Geminicoccaceae bacterium]